MTFNELGINPTIENILKQIGISAPTPIQEKAIPEIITGKDVIAQAQTGTGKTLAFLLPIIEKTDLESSHIQALIVTPTRELALQITAELQKFADKIEGLEALAVYGGKDVERQLKKLKKSISVVVATPGRLLDHIRRGTIDLTRVEKFILDEADQMLHTGFLPEIEEILTHLPKERQMLLFSATMPEEVKLLAKRFMVDPMTVAVKSEQVTVEKIRQLVIETTDRTKKATLFKVLDEERPFLAIIFCRTKLKVSKLNDSLKAAGYNADELHGDLSQAKRERVMKSFRKASIQLLVATDVAARGLDVEGVTHVFNFDVPEDTESYIHRIGRTGRAGDHGLAVTFVVPRDERDFKEIEKGIKLTIERRVIEGIQASPGTGSPKLKRAFGNTAKQDYNLRHGIEENPQEQEYKGPRKSDRNKSQAKPNHFKGKSNRSGSPRSR